MRLISLKMTSFVCVRHGLMLRLMRKWRLNSERSTSLKFLQNRVFHLGALDSTLVSVCLYPASSSVLSPSRSYFRHKDIFDQVLPNCFQSQRRYLFKHGRRPVPHNLAYRLYEQLIESHETIKPRDTKAGTSLLSRLDKVGNPEEQIKSLSTSDIIACLYACREQAGLTSKTNSIIQSPYEDKKVTSSGHADVNLLLQAELSKRVKTEELETLLHCAHAAFSCGDRRLYFLSSLLNHILEEFEELSLTKSQFIKILFYIYYRGDAPERLLFNLQNYLSENMDSFDFSELHVVSLGFFRANKRINDYFILNRLADRLLQNLNTVSGDALVSLMKTFRHSGFTKVSFFTELAEELTSMDLQNITSQNQIMHLAMAFGSLRLYHEALLTSLVSRSRQILRTIPKSKVRTKDLGRLVWALGTFNYKDEDFLQNIVVPVFTESLGGAATAQYPESLVDVAMGMAYLGLYCDDIISAIFSPKTAAKLRDMTFLEKSNQLLYLHHSVKLEHPSYHGNTLSKSFLDSLPSKVYGDMDRELSFRQGLASSLTTLQELLGEDKVCCTFILPHFQTADLEIHLNRDNQPIQTGCVSEEKEKASVHKRIAIEVIGQNQCAVDSEILLGNSRAKLRQLHRIGYVTHMISASDARNLDTMDSQSRKEYFRSVLHSELKVKL